MDAQSKITIFVFANRRKRMHAVAFGVRFAPDLWTCPEAVVVAFYVPDTKKPNLSVWATPLEMP
jgi:hypothetical protein